MPWGAAGWYAVLRQRRRALLRRLCSQFISRPALTRVNSILDRLDKREGAGGKLMVDPSLYNNAKATLASAHELIEAIRKDPKTYLTIQLKIF